MSLIPPLTERLDRLLPQTQCGQCGYDGCRPYAQAMARGEVVSKVWEYIKAHKLQNPDDGREIVADDKLRRVFGKDRVTMFEMNKHLAQHLK